MRNMVFGDYFDTFMSDRSFLRKPSDKVSISKEEFDILKEKAEKYEAISGSYETLRLENKELKDVLKELKEDGRKFKDLEEENKKYLESLLRVRADFENYKKFNEREREKFKFYAMEKILEKLIKHYDDLLRNLKVIELTDEKGSLTKGFQMIIKNFKKLLEEEGVKPMDCEGEIFDPYKHEALMVEERDDLPENTIIEELDKGYYFNNNVLRPARVKISKKSRLQNLNKN